MVSEVYLTGIKSNEKPHLGNYLGAIRPALEFCQSKPSAKFLYFMADYHALTTVRDGKSLRASTYEVAASWLGCGLDPNKVLFYRQSDVPEIFELNWILACHTPKGDLNRAHSYKDKVAVNESKNADPDKGINSGLFTYPVLMASDILLFDATHVPVGKDQRQHVEMARSMAQRINEYYGNLLVEPQEVINQSVQIIPGLDGRKMSKSYGNTIELFSSSKKLQKSINKIKTDSSGIGEPKDPTQCDIFSLYKLFAQESECKVLAEKYQKGIGWGEAKAELFTIIERELAPKRDVYESYISQPEKLEFLLQEGAEKARSIAKETIKRLRKSILGR